MARKPIDGYLPYLDDVLALWDEFGHDFRVGSITRVQAQKLRDDLASVLDRINQLQVQLGSSIDNRDLQISGIEQFAVQFRSAVIAMYGSRSPQAQRTPLLVPRRVKKTVVPEKTTP